MSQELVILVAEDDPCDRLLLEWAFSKTSLGVILRFVHDGQEVMDYLQGEPPFNDRTTYPLPQLLLLDLMMTPVSGFDVLAWLQQQPGLEQMLLVALSGLDRHADIHRACTFGVHFYLTKPQDPTQLMTTLGCMVQECCRYLQRAAPEPAPAQRAPAVSCSSSLSPVVS